ncbi:unnamed protein product [Brassica rapa]|uniref:Uncharacterized protein n=1 Tax=Brassica campestris TaxID=3711 RepID=A0A8D9LW11_BRACM|nr:unnamed protein product [Brassica rapa]
MQLWLSYFSLISENLVIRSVHSEEKRQIHSKKHPDRQLWDRQKEVTDSAKTTQRSSLKLGYMDEYQNGAENIEKRRNVKEEKKIVGEEKKVLKKTDPFFPVSIFTVVATTTA